MDDELEGSRELGLKGGYINFAVALPCVAVAGLEECALGVHGDEERGAFNHLLVVHVASVDARRRRVQFAGRTRRRNAHAAEEGMQRNGDAGGKGAGHVREVKRDDLLVALGKVLGKKAVLACAVAGPGNVDVHFLDAYFQHVAGFGFLNGDGAGEDVASGAAVRERDLVVDVANVVGDLGARDAAGFEAIRGAAGR